MFQFFFEILFCNDNEKGQVQQNGHYLIFSSCMLKNINFRTKGKNNHTTNSVW